jgi:lipid II:glycine glycyltransferase (peptidoglycan interpeptide bridge formation enzyme)
MTGFTYKIIEGEVEENSIWDSVVTHPLQSWAWGNFRSKRQDVSRLGVYSSGKLIKAFLIVWTKIKPSNLTVGYIPMGNCPTNEDLEQFKQIGRSKSGVLVRVEPNFCQEVELIAIKKLSRGRPLFKPMTFVIDLKLSEEQLLERMHPKGRYNIRVAIKHGVVFKEDNSESAFNDYIKLMFTGTAKRQGIYMHGERYHRQMWQHLRKSGIAHLWTATYDGKTIVADLIFRFHDWIYYAYGATALEHKETMAATGLLWEIMMWGKRAGADTFDLWGAEQGKGFSRFKEQFGGDLKKLPGTYDLNINPFLYPLFKISEEARWWILHNLK